MPTERVKVTILYEKPGAAQITVMAEVHVGVTYHELMEAACSRLKVDSREECYFTFADDQRRLEPTLSLKGDGVTGDITLCLDRASRKSSSILARIDKQTRQRSRDLLPDTLQRLALMDQRSERVWRIRYHPAIVGRCNRDVPEQNFLLAVDLESLPRSNEISRHHACIDVADNAYRLFSIRPNNPTFLNNREIPYREYLTLKVDDEIKLATVTLRVIPD